MAYPPWASPPGSAPMPPSYVWQLHKITQNYEKMDRSIQENHSYVTCHKIYFKKRESGTTWTCILGHSQQVQGSQYSQYAPPGQRTKCKVRKRNTSETKHHTLSASHDSTS